MPKIRVKNKWDLGTRYFHKALAFVEKKMPEHMAALKNLEAFPSKETIPPNTITPVKGRGYLPGLYSTASKGIRVSTDRKKTPYLVVTIAHELQHAFDDYKRPMWLYDHFDKLQRKDLKVIKNFSFRRITEKERDAALMQNYWNSPPEKIAHKQSAKMVHEYVKETGYKAPKRRRIRVGIQKILSSRRADKEIWSDEW